MSDNGNSQSSHSVKDRVLVPEEDRPRIPKAMTVAASDSGAGAGVQADLRTFAAHGVYGTSTVVAITAQSTKGVYAIAEVPDEVIVAQIDMMMEDIGADAAKTGMLSSRLIVEVVADRLTAWGVPIVVDPVMVAKSGDQLMQPSAVAAYKRHLLPGALIVTPNIPEAEVLSGVTITDEATLRDAARGVAAVGPKWVLVKGGHRQGPAVDLLFDGTDFVEFENARIPGYNTHGTGCTLSAAITANLTLGQTVPEAVAGAIDYLHGAMRSGYAIGGGHSPVNHFFQFPVMGPSAAEGADRSTTEHS